MNQSSKTWNYDKEKRKLYKSSLTKKVIKGIVVKEIKSQPEFEYFLRHRGILTKYIANTVNSFYSKRSITIYNSTYHMTKVMHRRLYLFKPMWSYIVRISFSIIESPEGKDFWVNKLSNHDSKENNTTTAKV